MLPDKVFIEVVALSVKLQPVRSTVSEEGLYNSTQSYPLEGVTISSFKTTAWTVIGKKKAENMIYKIRDLTSPIVSFFTKSADLRYNSGMERSSGIMLLSSEIRRFLFEVYGYGKVRDFVVGNKPKEQNLRDFFAGTVIGSWRANAWDKDAGDVVFVRWPRISRINLSEETGIKDRRRLECMYHLDNNSFFRGFSGDEVKEFFDTRARLILADAKFDYIRPGRGSTRWEYSIRASNFELLATGSSGINSKSLMIDFDIPADLVSDTNRIVGRYYGMMNSIVTEKVPVLFHKTCQYRVTKPF